MAPFDIVALAKRINLRREEFNRLYPHRPVKISTDMSRIIANDPDYVPYRKRNPARKKPATINPSIRTLVRIADALGTTVGDLLGEATAQLGPAEEHMLRQALKVLEGIARWPER